MLGCAICRKVIVDDALSHCVRCGASLRTPGSRIDLVEKAPGWRSTDRRLTDALFVISGGLACAVVFYAFYGMSLSLLWTFLLGAASSAFILWVYSGYLLATLIVAVPQLFILDFTLMTPFIVLGHLCIGAVLDYSKAALRDLR